MRYLMIYIMILLSWISVYADSWTEVGADLTTKPEAREGHSLVVYNSQLWLFGGKNFSGTTLYNDLWYFDQGLKEWSKRTATNDGPSDRYGHSAAVYNGKMYVFFGRNATEALDDIWSYEFATNKWTDLTTTTRAVPVARFDHQVVVVGAYAWLFGGSNMAGGAFDGKLWRYKFSDNTWLETTRGTVARFGHAWIAVGNTIYLFGGRNPGFINTLSTVDVSTPDSPGAFIEIDDINAPQGRAYCSFVGNTDYLWVVGGTISTTRADETTNGHYRYNIDTKTWTSQTYKPRVTKAAAAILAAPVRADFQYYLFGGEYDSAVNNKLYLYSEADNDDDDDGDDDTDISISCGATGAEVLFAFLFLLIVRRLSRNARK